MLHAQIMDPDGSARALRWGPWHIQIMREAAACDFHGIEPNDYFALDVGAQIELDVATPLSREGYWTLTREFTYYDTADGEVLHLPVGARLALWG